MSTENKKIVNALKTRFQEMAEKHRQDVQGYDIYKENRLLEDLVFAQREDVALIWIRGNNQIEIGGKVSIIPQIGFCNMIDHKSPTLLPDDGSFCVYGHHLIVINKAGLQGHIMRNHFWDENQNKVVPPQDIQDQLSESDRNVIEPLIAESLWDYKIFQKDEDPTEFIKELAERQVAACVQATVCYAL